MNNFRKNILSIPWNYLRPCLCVFWIINEFTCSVNLLARLVPCVVPLRLKKDFECFHIFLLSLKYKPLVIQPSKY